MASIDKNLQEFFLPINSNAKGNLYYFENLTIEYLDSENNLCPSIYDPNIRCFWEGDLSLTLKVNSKKIILNDHDSRKGIFHTVDGYRLFGLRPFIKNSETYMVFGISTEPVESDESVESIPQYRLGEIFEIRKGENPTTGYRWESQTSPGLEIVKTHFILGCPNSNKSGCGGTRVWNLKGTKKGIQTLKIRNIRPWEDNSNVQGLTFNFEII